MDDPLRLLVTDALGFMNRAFVDVGQPLSVRCEFYHQFRKLWDRGIPVGMGLGHLLVKQIDGGLGIVRLGERGAESENLAAVLFEGQDSAADYSQQWRVICSNNKFVIESNPKTHP